MYYQLCIITFIFLLFLPSLSLACVASEVFVNAATGQDIPSNGATRGTAVASLEYALNFIHPCDGSVVYVASGEYFLDTINFLDNITVVADEGPLLTKLSPNSGTIALNLLDNGLSMWSGFSINAAIISNSSVTFYNCMFEGLNEKPISCTHGNLTLQSSIFQSNTFPVKIENSELKIDNCQFLKNEGLGALMVMNSTFNVNNSIFEHNSFTLVDGTDYYIASYLHRDIGDITYAAGGSAISASFSFVSIFNCSFFHHNIYDSRVIDPPVVQYSFFGGAVLLYWNHFVEIDSITIIEGFITTNLLFADFGGDQIYIHSEVDVTVKNSYFSNPFPVPDQFSGGNIMFTGETSVTNFFLENLTLQDHSNTALYFSNLNQVIVSDIKVVNVSGPNSPTVLSMDKVNDISILRSSFSHSYGTLIDNSIAIMLIDDCTFANNLISTVVLSSSSDQTTITNCRFDNNTGAAVYALQNFRNSNGGYMFIKNTTFTKNYAPALLTRISVIRIEDSQFIKNSISNTSDSGGTIQIDLSETTISNCTFDQNSGPFGGGVYAASMVTFGFGVPLVIENSIFTNNVVSQNGGAIGVTSPGLSYELSVTNCSFSNNNAANGGAIYASNSDISIKLSEFHKNSALGSGGALHYETMEAGRSASVTNNVFYENFVVGENAAGGAIRISQQSGIPVSSVVIRDSDFRLSYSGANGGALLVSSSDVIVSAGLLAGGYPVTEVIDCTFLSNSAHANGGAIYSSQFASVYVVNSTLQWNSAGIDGGALNSVNSRISLDNVDIKNSTATFNGGAISMSITEPLFPYTRMNNVSVEDNSVQLGNGGGLALFSLASVMVSINASNFINNTALSFGGAIYTGTYSSPVIRTSRFLSNTAFLGGGIYGEIVASPRIFDSTFYNNYATSDGGAAGFAGKSAPIFESTVFDKNKAPNGGALVSSAQSSVSVVRCSFIGNEAVDSGRGGAIYATTIIPQYPVVSYSTFDSNTAAYGGAYYGSASPLISNSNFTKNTARTEGGGIHISSTANASIDSSIFVQNSAQFGGGAYCETFSTLTLFNVNYTSNTADTGGAVQMVQKSYLYALSSRFSLNSAQFGGAISVMDNKFFLKGVDFISNTAKEGNGGGLYLTNGMQTSSLTTRMEKVSFQSCSALGGAGGALFWGSESTNLTYIQSMAPSCNDCLFSNNAASYGKDFATAPTSQYFTLMPTDSVVRDGIIGPFVISVADFYNQTVSSALSLRSQVGIRSISKEAISPQLTGTTAEVVQNGSVTYNELAISGLFKNYYSLYFSIAGDILGTVKDLEVIVLFGGCSSGQEQITTSSKFNTCKFCSEGSYNLNGNGTCISCPSHATCTNGREVTAAENYWLYVENGVADTYNCPDGFCENGECGEHRSGLLCGTCDEGYQSSFGKCIACDASYDPVSLFGNIVLLWLFVVLLQYSSKLPDKVSTVEDRYVISGLTKIILFFIQTVTLVSTPGEDLKRLFSFFNFQFIFSFASKCTIRMDFYGSFMFSIFMPAVLFGFLFANFILQHIIHLICSKTGHSPSIELTRTNRTTYIRTICALVLFSYSQVTEAVFMYLNCRDVGPFRVVASAPDVSCDSSKYSGYSAFAYVLLCAYVVLLPIFMLAILVRYNKKGKLSGTPFSEKFGIIFQCFRSHHFYWEVVILIRRLLFIMIYVVAYSVPAAQSLALFIFAFLMLVLHLTIKPYFSKIENWIETALLSLLVLLAGIESAEASNAFEHKIDILSSVITFLAVVPILIGLYCLIIDILRRLGIKIGSDTPPLSRTTTVETWKDTDTKDNEGL